MVWSGWVAVVVVAAGAGCGGRLGNDFGAADAGATLSPRPTAEPGTGGPPDGGASDAAWPLVRTHRLTTESVEAVQLATNGSAVFGITDHNGVWSLPPGDTAVRMLVAPGDRAAPSGEWGSRLVAAGNDLYWVDRAAGALHRTRADASADEVLADGLNGVDTLAVDDTRVYWSEVTYIRQGGGIIRSLPRDAAPRDPPATLVSVDMMSAISSLAASGGTLYWTSFKSIGTTMYGAGLFAGSVEALLLGGSGAPLEGNNPYGVTAIGGAVFYGYHRDLWTTALVDLPFTGRAGDLLSILPINVRLAGVAVTQSWLIVTAKSNVGTEIYIAPRNGAGLVRIAQGLRTAAIVGPAGVTFIDASGALVFIDTDDLGYIGFGHPAP